MASGVSFVWIVTWALWGAVVYKDWRRSVGDRRWLASLAAFVLLAAMTRSSLVEFDLRATLLIGIAVGDPRRCGPCRTRGRRSVDRGKEAWARSAGFEPVAIARRRLRRSTCRRACDGFPCWAAVGRPEPRASSAASLGDGRELLVFDHAIRRRVIWYDANGVEAAGTVVAIRRPGHGLPLFQVRPIGLFAWMDGGAARRCGGRAGRRRRSRGRTGSAEMSRGTFARSSPTSCWR